MSVLKRYRREASILQADFAERVGVTQATISKIERGVALPSLELAFAIERETGSQVPASSWVAVSEASE